MDLGPYYPTLAASDRLRILVEELRWEGPTREILSEVAYLAEELESAEGPESDAVRTAEPSCPSLKLSGHPPW